MGRAKTVQNKGGLFEVLSEDFRPQHNEALLFFQYCKLIREQSEMLNNGWATSELRQMNVNIKKNTQD